MNRLTTTDKNGGIVQPLYTSTSEAFLKLAKYENTGLEPEEVEELKARIPKDGEWVSFTDDNGNKRSKCSICDGVVARNSQRSKYCPACGARLKFEIKE